MANLTDTATSEIATVFANLKVGDMVEVHTKDAKPRMVQVMDTEWKHSRVAWAPPYHPTEKWWRRMGALTLHLHAEGYCDAKGNRVATGDHHTNPPVLAMEWAIEDTKSGTWVSRGRLLVRDYPSLNEAFLAAQKAAESAAALYRLDH